MCTTPHRAVWYTICVPPISTEPLLPAALAEHTVESLHALHGRARPWVYWTLLAGVLLTLASLPAMQVEVSFSAPGIVRPATERVEVRAPFGGAVAALFCRDNASVASGDPLLRLATPDLDERLAHNAALQREKQALVAALEHFSTARPEPADVLPAPESGASVDTFPETRVLRQEWLQLTLQLEANRLAEAKAGAELERAATLATKGIATQRELDDARYALERVRAEGRLLFEQARTRWQTRREEESLHLSALQSERRRLESEREQATLRAPSAGTVQGLVGLAPGAHITAGQTVAIISPDDRLLVETLVSSRDIAGVRPGQTVRLQIDAFPYTQWGLLEAHVVAIAADVAAPGSGQPAAFKVTLQPTRIQLALPNGATGVLAKGMTTSARFVTSRRTLLQLLYQNAAEWLDPQNAPTSARR